MERSMDGFPIGGFPWDSNGSSTSWWALGEIAESRCSVAKRWIPDFFH
jgi:hypothetical protein